MHIKRTKSFVYKSTVFCFSSYTAFLLQANPIQCNTFPVSGQGPTSEAVSCALINTERRSLVGRVKMAACGWGGCGSKLGIFRHKRFIWILIETVIEKIAISTYFTHLCVILDWAHDIYTLRGSPAARDRGSAQWQVAICCGRRKELSKSIFICWVWYTTTNVVFMGDVDIVMYVNMNWNDFEWPPGVETRPGILNKPR